MKCKISSGYFLVCVWVLSLTALHFIELKVISPSHQITSALCQWDCFWYKSIADVGYLKFPNFSDQSNPLMGQWAFFPLFPLLVRYVCRLFGTSFVTTAIAVNFLLFLISILLIAIFLRKKSIKDLSSIVLFCFINPLNIWFFSPQSEALYGVLLMGLLCCFTFKKHLSLLAGTSFLITLARPTGLVSVTIMSVNCCWEIWKQYQSSFRELLSDRKVRYYLSAAVVLLLGAGCALGIYINFLYGLVGDGMAFQHVQQAWGRDGIHSVGDVVALFTNKPHTTVRYLISLGAALIVICSKGWRLAGAILMAPLIIGMLSGSFMSCARFTLGSPIAIAFVANIFCSMPRYLKWPTAILLCILNGLVVFLWVHKYHGFLL